MRLRRSTRSASSSCSCRRARRRTSAELRVEVRQRARRAARAAPRATRSAWKRRRISARTSSAVIIERSSSSERPSRSRSRVTSRQPLDIGLGVHTVLALRALAARQQAELLVVADRARRDAAALRDLADAERHAALLAATGRLSDVAHVRWAEHRDPCAEERDACEHPQREVHVRDERLQLLRRETRRRGPEKILKRTSFGTAAVTTAITKAIEITAPVFCSITRAPAAMPRRCTGTAPIIAAVFGLLNMPEPMPTSASQSALQTYRVSACSIVIPARPIAVTSIPRAASAARAVAVGNHAGDRRGEEHADRERRELEPGHDRRLSLGALEVEDEQKHQGEAREAVQERGRRRGCEQTVSKEVEVEHRRAAAALDHHEERQEDDRSSEAGDHEPVAPAGKAALREREHEPGETDDVRRHPKQVEAALVAAARALLEHEGAPHTAEEAERHVEPEDPRPRDRDQRTAEDGPDHEPHCGDHRVRPHREPELATSGRRR